MRYPFEDAISDENLLKNAFEGLSFPQQVTLKAFYGCKLDPKRINPETGFNELDYWAIVQGSFEHDELGYVTKIKPIPYEPQEYDSLWAVIGRRAGKTSQLMAFIVAYEALLGGHEDYIQSDQECAIYLIGHRLDLASANIPFVRAIIDSSPLMREEVEKQNADGVFLKNGIKIVPSSPSIKAQRGFAIPVVAMDEVGFWYTDSEAANPDYEVMRAVMYSQLQFPNAKKIGISTPWTKEGLLYKYYRAGTNGSKLPSHLSKDEYFGVLSCFATTAAFENPLITRKRLAKIKAEDEDAFPRESLCQFSDSISGFLSSKLVEIAAEKGRGVAERAPLPEDSRIRPYYVAAMDPAFRSDSFAFAIVHKEAGKGIVVDVLKRWTPLRGQRLNPAEILAEIKQITTPYNIDLLLSDQYQLESLSQIAINMGMVIEGVDFTGASKAKIFGSLQQLVNQQKLVLLDTDLNEDAKVTVQELIQLERKSTGRGTVLISAPEGKHDDMACALALATSRAILVDPDVVETVEVREPTAFERCMATIQRNNIFAREEW